MRNITEKIGLLEANMRDVIRGYKGVEETAFALSISSDFEDMKHMSIGG